MPFDLLTIGDSVIDEFMEIDDATVSCDIDHEKCELRLNYADKIQVKKFRKEVGGNAVNIAVGAKTLGLDTAIYTEVGDDGNGDLIIETLENAGVDITYCNQTETPTDVHPVIVFKGERTIFSYHTKREYHLAGLEAPKFIYYTSIGEGFEKFQSELESFIEKNPDMIVAMNPGSTQLHANLEVVRKFLKNVDVLFVNKQEAELLMDSEGSVDDLHKKLSEAGVKLSVITDSTNGSSSFDGTKLFKIGIYDIDGAVVDKTGAGDAFASGFLGAMFHGKDAEEALKWGAINSASGIAEVGATTGLCTKEQIEEKLKTNSNLFTKAKL